MKSITKIAQQHKDTMQTGTNKYTFMQHLLICINCTFHFVHHNGSFCLLSVTLDIEFTYLNDISSVVYICVYICIYSVTLNLECTFPMINLVYSFYQIRSSAPCTCTSTLYFHLGIHRSC